MKNTRQKQDTQRGGRKTPPPLDSETPDQESSAASTLDARIQAMMDTLKNDLFSKMDTVAVGLHSEISSVRGELKASIEPLQRLVDSHEAAVRDLEQAANDHSSRITELEATVTKLSAQVIRLDDKCEDLESRSRRNNIRVVGVPEGMEGPRPTDFIAVLLQDLLGLEEKTLLNRAHRSLRNEPAAGSQPRAFIVRVHFFHVRNTILRRAGESSPLLYKDKRISVFPDFTSSVAKKRSAFSAVKRSLRSFPEVKFGLLYPATLKITMPGGTSWRFEDPSLASDFVKKNCK